MSTRLREAALVERSVGAHEYSCDGDGEDFFTLNGFTFSPDPRCEPDVIYDQIEPDRQEFGWWKAQCLFRGLEAPRGGIPEVMAFLKEHVEKDMSADIKARANEMADEYKAKKEKARKELWEQCKSDIEKVDLDPERFLKTLIPEGTEVDGDKEPILLKLGPEGGLLGPVAAGRKLFYADIDMPILENGMITGREEHQIVGRDRAKVDKKAQEVASEAEKAINNMLEQRKETARVDHGKIVNQAKEKADWDVTGVWTIRCPKIEARWDMEKPLEVGIYARGTGAERQLFAKFDFNILTGIWRFENPASVTQPAPNARTGEKRKANSHTERPSSKKQRTGDVSFFEDFEDNSEDDDDEDVPEEADKDGGKEHDEDDENEDDEDKLLVQTNFKLGPNDKPSPTVPRWAYRWLGYEDSTGSIMVEDEEPSYITFSNYGTELEGEFTVSFLGTYKIRGVKTATIEPSSQVSDVDALWEELLEQFEAQLQEADSSDYDSEEVFGGLQSP